MPPSRSLRPNPALLALLLMACAGAGQCPSPPDSADRIELRRRLQPLVHVSQCPGPPTPKAFEARQADLARKKEALIEQVGRSNVAEDLARVRREDDEANRLVNEADCAMPFWNRPEDPENVAAWPAQLGAEREKLLAAEAAFLRIMAACKAR
ncbi:MAG TPA: hypothetical protein VF645_10435 [Allosphingosinicella sp.]|jgi:hypothetical protein